MGRGRKPCCDKSKVKKGPWSPEEDLRLINYIQKHGHENWRNLPKQAGLLRCGKSCRLRWINYLRPDVKRGNFTLEEEQTIIKLHQTLGNKWSQIASQLPGRTDNEIKNVWNTYLKKRVASRGSSDSAAASTSSSSGSVNSDGMIDMKKEKCADAVKVSVDYQSFQHQLSPGIGSGSNEKEFSVNSVSSESNVTDSSPVDISMPEDLISSLFVPSETSDKIGTVQNCLFTGNNDSETNKAGLEVPLESDLDFWSMLESDNFGILEPNIEVQASEGTNCSSETSFFEEQLRHLKHELGLEDCMNQDQGSVGMIQDQGSVGMISADQLPISPGFDQTMEASDAEFDQEIMSFLDIDI